MPAFHPPLAHTSHVPIPTTSSHPYVQLNFFATFADEEDTAGSWELWTDLPKLDDQGNIITQPGEWRAAQFQPYLSPTPHSNGHAHTNGDLTTPVVHVKAFEGYPSAPHNPKTFYLSIVVPASIGQESSYTYRHVTPSGETHWLGGMGGNGFIKLDGRETEAQSEGPRAGAWSDAIDRVDDIGWHGIAVELQKSKGAIRPVITTLPSSSQLSAQLALLTATQPLHSSTFSNPTATPTPILPSAAIQHLSIAGGSFPFDVSPFSPVPSATDELFYGLTTGSSSVEALTAAFKAAKAKQERFHLAEVSGSKEAIAAIFMSSHGQTQLEQDFLIIHAPSLASPVDINITLPCDTIDSVPIALLANSSNSIAYLSQFDSKTGNRKIHLHLDQGSIAEVIQLAEFIELRGSGGDDPVWICAPDAINVEFGEEEISQPEFTATSAPISAYTEVTPVKIRDEEVENTSKPLLVTEDHAPSSHDERSSIPPPPQPSHGWWLFRFIGRFFVNIWELLLWPFRSNPAITEGSQQNDQGGTDQEDTATDLPANERTPLLSSQNMSRETSSSSTAFDPLATPFSVTELKPKYPTDGSVTPVGHQPSPNLNELPTINSVRIRSYAQMTFTHLPPFRFVLPPNSVDITSRLRFTVKEKAAMQWEEVEPHFKVQEDLTKCQELIVQGRNGTGGTDWEVQVDRI
ncbi:hypothetical protein I302_101167 [Kwoniella bestiolae CBS 10118]|uniref:Uncharacterized protein n=1 Tax=Kwoniella bestiolae CBS 10118 TaxID=1296100 RepID=A0A1B9G761_9TREE|nr:hypothetical protein I302_04542 [Kwoniella bestiolae CBS 10118]OCF26852.1 hypothetical protein I302_04542 [Kwoniella bestiolae CBS 10118]